VLRILFSESWKQLKDAVVAQWADRERRAGGRVEFIDATASTTSQDIDSPVLAFRPEGRETRSDFSQHISS
jgi:hypothetical protein